MNIDPMKFVPLGVLAVSGVFSYATLSSDTKSNSDDIEDNALILQKHETQIDQLDREVITIKHKLDTVQDMTSETKDDVKQILTIMREQTR